MKITTFFIILVLFLEGSNIFAQMDECTIGAIHGSVTSDGRPIAFKNRDATAGQQRLNFFSDSDWKYSYIGVYSYGGLPTMGLNSAGLASCNSGVIPDTGEYKYENAKTSRYILANFDNTDDVTAFLDSQNIFRVTACYPFIDNRGEAIMIEALKPRESREPRWMWTYNTTNPNRESQDLLGIVPRSVEHHKRNDGTDDLEILRRYKTARINLTGLRDLDLLNVQTIIQGNNGTQGYEVLRYGPYRSLPQIAEDASQSAVVVHGVNSGEDPALSTMWVILGPPNYCIAVPAWVKVGSNIPACLKFGRMWDRARSLYQKRNLFKTQASTFPAEAHIFNMVYNEIMPYWRENGVPPADEMSRVHNILADDAYSLLYCLDKRRSDNKAPEIGPIKTKIKGSKVLEFSVSANDPDGYLVSYGWDFGDGEVSTQESPEHTYSEEGTYLISCRVVDNEEVSITSWRYLTVDTTSVGVDNTIYNEEAKVQVYPNPTRGSFMIELPGSSLEQYELELLNMAGKVVMYKTGTSERKLYIELTDREKGVYMLRIKQDAKIFNSKIIVY